MKQIFITWEQLALFTIKAQKLQDHIIEGKEPPKYASDAEKAASTISSKNEEWQQEDFNLSSWLASFDSSFKNKMIHYTCALQMWQKLRQLFSESTRRKIKQFRAQLKNSKKQSLSITKYLSNIKKLGTLTQVPAIISHMMHQISSLPMTIQALISFSLQTVLVFQLVIMVILP
ncbi:uncharacterized protein DS421_13g436840 [Arachis hypogaea]|nr:uncharacterized protein DS421_13g436840 [Arachis hypogaea]